MKYLVTMELIGSPPTTSLPEMVQWLEQVVVPSEEAFIALEAKGTILAGGDLTGRRGWAAIFEAASNEELSHILDTIPEWPFMKVDVIPLESTESRLARLRQSIERMKSELK